MTLIKNFRELGFKEFMKRWKNGILELQPEQLLKAEISGYTGSILGTLLACYVFIFVYENMWAIAIILFFNIIIQGSQLIGKYQTLNQIKEMQKYSFTEIEELGGVENE